MTLLPVQLPNTSAPFETGAFGFPVDVSTLTAPGKVLVNGQGIPLRNNLIWGYKSGVTPQVAALTMTKEYASKVVAAINQADGVVTLEAAGNDVDNKAASEKWEKLSLAPRVPSTETHDTLVVYDDRWRWANKNVYFTANLVRKVDDAHVITEIAGTLKLSDCAKYYVPWTIKHDANGAVVGPYSALDLVKRVLIDFLGYKASDIDTSRASLSDYIPPNIVLVGQKAHSVISRFLGMSDNNLFIDKDGKVVIFAERVPYGMLDYETRLKPALRGVVQGALWVQDRQSIRPTNIYLSHEKEFECLLTYKETASASDSEDDTVAKPLAGNMPTPAQDAKTALEQLANRQVYLENVTETVLDNQVDNLPAGTLVTIEKALEAFGMQYGSEAITLDQFRENYGLAAQAVFANVFTAANAADASLDANAVLAWDRITADYRYKYRLPNKVLEYIKDVNAYLVEVIDPSTGKRRPSEVFSKVSWVVSISIRGQTKRPQGITLDSFNNLAQNGKYRAVPMLVSDVNMDTGEFTIHGVDDADHPGTLQALIIGRPRSGDKFFEDSFAEGEIAQDNSSKSGAYGLDANWEMSTVMSMTLLPQGPETMQWVDTEPFSKAGFGQPVEVHLTYDTARYALENVTLDPYRHGSGETFVNKLLLGAVDKQEGRRRWVTFEDQIIGSVTCAMSQQSLALRPYGPIGNVQVVVSPQGAMRVAFAAVPISEGRAIENLLESETLEAVFKQVHFDTAVGTR